MRHPPTPQLSVKAWGVCVGGGGGSLGGVLAGGWGGGVGWRVGGGRLPGGGVPKVGGPAHYYHMHTSRGDVCLGVWGYGGLYVIIALSRLCWEESLKCRRWPLAAGAAALR